MKRYIFLAFGLLLALNLGCVYVQYPTIGDNTGVSGPVGAINTNGKAHVAETGQTISFLPNGDNAELVAFVDQDAKGFHRLTTYQIVSSGSASSHFHSDTYCNPDWTGCSFVSTAYDSYQSPSAICSWAGLGAKFNFNCVDVSFIGLCTTYRYQECGRGFIGGNSLSLIMDAINLGTPATVNNREALRYNINSANTNINFSGAGVSQDLKLRGNIVAYVVPFNHSVRVDLRDSALGYTLRDAASKMRSINAPNALVTMDYMGLQKTINTAKGGAQIDQWEKVANAQY